MLAFNLKTMNVNNGNEDSVLNIKAEIFSHLPFLLFNPAENFSLEFQSDVMKFMQISYF